ncbi:MAG TPA: dihydroorotate dehydrogenase-like protein [Candidatus Polarisedimenticolaceae bacterium]|nr:dihydroorotate dehydrogenase-like protein [Candidatus Polarisedimenticolaceae bacterium]
MSLQTSYLGFRLPHPLIPGASPLADEIDGVRRLEDAGASMIVLRSLFEEQLVHEQMAAQHGIDAHENAFAEALSYLPSPEAFRFGPGSYLEHLARVKRAVGVPVVASLNGTTPGGWVEYAHALENAGADALELNLFLVPTDAAESAAAIEDRLVALVHAVRGCIAIPLAVKLSPFFTSVAHFARRLEAEHVDGLVLFNRFYEPDIDVREQTVLRMLSLSRSSELLPRLHGLAIVAAATRLPLAVTGGVHTGVDALKAVMCGASGVQMVSSLLMKGVGRLTEVRRELERALADNEYDSLDQVRGSMSLTRCPDPKAYERVNYMQILQSWRG